jgi:hypothetical protein
MRCATRSGGEHSGDKNLAFRQLDVLPHLPLMLVLRIGRLDRIGLDVDFEQNVRDVPQGEIMRMRSMPRPPANVQSHHVLRHARETIIEQRGPRLGTLAVIANADRRFICFPFLRMNGSSS